MSFLTTGRNFTDKEALRILEFITKSGEIKKPQKPLKILAEEIMLNCFGWPSNGLSSPGYKRTRAAVLELETRGQIECDWSPGKRLMGIRRKKIKSPLPESIEKTAPAEPTVAGLNKLKDLTEIDCEATARRMQIFRHLKPKGWARRKAENFRRGERHENWLHTSILALLEVLTREFPKLVWDGSCSRSGHHNPRKGKIDLQDHWGEDVSLRLTVRHPHGQLITGRMIYDGKGARSSVTRFNENIKLYPGQESALLKKAIWSNVIHRSRKDLLAEVLNDVISVGLLPNDFDKEKVLEFFED